MRKLSGPLPFARVSAVSDYAVARGERWIVYRADATLDEHLELYSVPTDGSAAPRALCGALAAELDVQEYRIAPDGLSVVYTVDTRFEGGHSQLFSAPIDGATPAVRLHERLPSWASILFGIQISPDSQRVVFLGDLLVDGRGELFSVPLDGSEPPVKLDPLLADGVVHEASISPDSRRVVFRMSQGDLELYSVALEGGPVTRLSGPSIPLGGVLEWRLAGERAVYLADPFLNDQLELFSVPIDGSLAPQRLNPPLASGTFVDPDSPLVIDPAGEHVVYRLFTANFGVVELHSVAVDGSTGDARIDAGMGSSGSIRMTASGRVLFLARPAGGNANSALYSVQADGSAPAVQLGTLPRNSNVTLFEPGVDGKHVVFVRTTPSALDVFVTNSDGSTPEIRLDRTPQDVSSIEALRVGATHAAYSGRLTVGGQRALFSAPLDGSAAPLRLLEPSPPLGDLYPGITLVGANVLQRTDWNEDGVVELFSVPLDASAPPTSLSGPGAFTTVGDVQRFARAGRFAVYLADQEQDGVVELYSADLDHGGPPRRLNDPLDATDDVSDFVVSPDERAVLFRARHGGRNGLYLAPSDGRTRARKLDADSAMLGGVESDYGFTPDGKWIVFVSNGRSNFLTDVFAVPSDGSAAARSLLTFDGAFGHLLALSPDSKRVAFCPSFSSSGGLELVSLSIDEPGFGVQRLSLPYSFAASVTSLRISTDSRYAVFRADVVTDERYLLYSWPLDGSTGLVPLMQPHSGGAIDFACAADGRVVFRILQPQDRIELFSVSADGSAPPTPLCALPPGRRVLEFVLSPDGRRVAYRADAETDDRYELFSAPSDGSASSVKLSNASRRDTDVSAFAFTPDSQKVLFLADTLRNEQDDLYVVPADRSTAPKRLNPSLAPHGTLFDFRCSDDGRFVAYRANHDERALVELFRVPIEGGVAPVPFSPPPIAGGDVRAYRFVSPSEVLYDADQDEDEAYELYFGVLSELRRPAAPPEPLR
ncbi:MAG: hypothetical protein EXS08_09720 [Planctomycetes bacterium]|nr:hypothetical protein [Planctomycetota bacterium]